MSNEPPQPPQPPYSSSDPFRPAFWRNTPRAKVSLVTVAVTLLIVTVCIVPCIIVEITTAFLLGTNVAQPPASTMTPTLPPPVHSHSPARRLVARAR
ncbi:MAG: hypothetical protein ACXWP6_16705 [Ktedonobacterales bacterium]